MSIIVWQTRPIFISSTFRDMHAERDHLHNLVFPDLEERLRERYHHLEPIDLRWGVETAGVNEQHAKEVLVLKVCLNEIERSRPFLIALLGDRYGWIPPKERMTSAAQEAGYLHDLSGRSVTALEIEYGVLNSEDQLKRSFFYFREPLPYQDMDPVTAAVYSDQYSHDAEGKEAHRQLIDLKTRIELEYPGQVRHYTAIWDREKNCVKGLEEWGRQVLEDLWGELDAETAEIAQHAATTWEEQERRSRDAFLENRSRDFTGREELLQTLTNLATSESIIGADWGASITGPAGSGKSALIARLAHNLDSEGHLMLLTACAGTTPESGRVELLLRRWVDELTTSLGINNPLTETTNAEELEQAFHQTLGRAAARQRVIILIDALNQFENSPQARHLTWLPKRLPTNSRLIATAIPCDASVALEGKSGVSTITLPPLNHSEADRIISTVCCRYHREMNPQIRTILLEKKDNTDNPACGNPLWLTMVLEELNMLDADDFARAEKQYIGTGEEKLLSLLIDTAIQLPGDVNDLYGWLLTRAEDVHGKAWAQAFINLIAISRTGWRESDLKALMPILSGRLWSDLDFAALRRGFRAHICQRGRQSQWDFSHNQMRIATKWRNLADNTTTRNLHTEMINHLLALPADDPLHESETMVHLIGADDQQRAAAYYGRGNLTDKENQGATQVLAEFLTSGEQEEDGAEIGWVRCMLDAVEAKKQTLIICTRFVFDLENVLKSQGRLRLRLALLQQVAEVVSKLSATNMNDAIIRLDSVIYRSIGDIFMLLGNTNKCRAAYTRSSELAEKLFALEPDNKDYLYDVWLSFGKIGDLNLRRDPETTRQWLLRALEIAERLTFLDPDNNEFLRALACTFERLGGLDERHNPEIARQWHLKALEITERLHCLEMDNAQYLRDLYVSFSKIGDLDLRHDSKTARQWYQNALATLEKLTALDPNNVKTLFSFAATLGRMGSLDERHDPEMASQWYQKALDIRKRLSALDPDNTDYLYALSVSFLEIGNLNKRFDLEAAIKWYKMSLETLAKLTAIEPDNNLYMRSLSVSFSMIGKMSERHDPELARQWYQKALEIRERLLSKEPENILYLHDISASFSRMGELDRLYAPESSKEWYQKSLKIIEQLLIRDPNNAEYLRSLSISFCKIGDLEEIRNPETARMYYMKALAIAERLSSLEPDNIDYRSLLSFFYSIIGKLIERHAPESARLWYKKTIEIRELLLSKEPENIQYLHDISTSFDRMGELDRLCAPESAKEWYQKSLKIIEQLLLRDPNNAEYLRSLSISFSRMGDLYLNSDPESARQWYGKGLFIEENLAKIYPHNAMHWRDVALSLSMIAETYQQQGVPEEELKYSQRADEAVRYAANLAPDDPDIQYSLACTRARLGETDQALAALVRSIDLGNSDADQMAHDADLKSLYGLPEFETLLERMRNKARD